MDEPCYAGIVDWYRHDVRKRVRSKMKNDDMKGNKKFIRVNKRFIKGYKKFIEGYKKFIKGYKFKIVYAVSCLLLFCVVFAGCSRTRGNTDETLIRVGSLKGPTSLGLLYLMEEAENGNSENNYEFQMAVGADELLPLMIKGELDIALVPANVASVLYAKTEGGVSVIDINTLGVLYMVSGDDSIRSVSDLGGRTIYLTGKGTTPDYCLRHILLENGMAYANITLEYRSEATEVAALLGENTDAVGLLPQPFVTVVCAQNEKMAVVLDMNEEWNALQDENGSGMVTGVTVVRNDFLEAHEDIVQVFLQEHAWSAEQIKEDTATGAAYAVKAGIIAQESIALQAIPQCNITCMTGDEMKKALEGYLQILYDSTPEAVGGAMPQENFYYIP